MEIPEGAVLLGSLSVVEYLDAEGDIVICVQAFGSDGDELDLGKLLELIEHARIEAIAPYLAHAVASYSVEDDE